MENFEDDDILGLLASDEKPFKPKVDEEPAAKPAYQNYNNNNNSSYNNGGGYKKYDGNKQFQNKPKKESLWDKKDIKPIKIDMGLMAKTKKTFGFSVHSSKEAVPEEIEEKLINISKVLFSKGYTFRYNGDKEDKTALKIVDLPNSKVDCFLPWKKYNEEFTGAILNYPIETAYGIGVNNHKIFMDLGPSIRAILSRDVHICLGKECTEPLDIMLMYNLDGTEVLSKTTDYKKLGNTNFYIRICSESNIPVYNFNKAESVTRLIEFLKAH